MYCCFVPYGWYVKASNTVSQFQQRLLHNFRNQSPTTFDKDHCCIIVCHLRGLSSSILSNRWCQYLEVDSGGFILYFWYSLAPPPPPIRHAKATTGFLASGRVIVVCPWKNINIYIHHLPRNKSLPPPPDLSSRRLNIHSMPQHHKSRRRWRR